MFEVIYECTATCVTHVPALNAEDAINMVRTGEAGDISEDHVGYERNVLSYRDTDMPVVITNRDCGDEQQPA